MVHLRLPFVTQEGQRLIRIDNVQDIATKTNLPEDGFSIYFNGRPVTSTDGLRALFEEGQDDVFLDLVLGLPGGKGGFGAMLRAIGAQIDKTTNKEAMRDLSGRRLRDINEEDRLKNYISKHADREREKEEKKKSKIQKLERLVKGENKHEFHDPEYMKKREEATERVHEAMEAAFKSAQSDEPQPSTSGVKRKTEEPKSAPAKKKGLWLGADLDSDLSDSSDDEAEASPTDKKSNSQPAVACAH